MKTCSIVIPTLGTSGVLPDLLHALVDVSSDYLKEVWIVFDGCAPNLKPGWPSFVRHLTTASCEGPAAARNRGAHEASGELVLFMDDDVVPRPGAVEQLMGDVVGQDSSIASTGCVVPHGSLANSCYQRFAYAGHAHLHHAENGQEAGFEAFCTSFAAVHRERFLKLGGFNPKFQVPGYEDVEFAYRFVKEGGRIVACADAIVEHHKLMDRSWFVDRCERNGRLLAQLHALHPLLRGELSFAPSCLRSLIAALAPGWPCCKKILPLCEGVPNVLAQPLLKLIHAVGIARSYAR